MPTPSRPDPSRRRKAFVLAAAVAIVNLPLAARAATPSALLDGYRQAAGAAPSPTRGQQFFTQGHGREWSCSSCHGAVPTATGRHASTGKPIAPDANSTLRVSFAHVQGYAPRDGVHYTPFTTLAGLLEKHTGAVVASTDYIKAYAEQIRAFIR